jgi:DNA-binding NarL/FixJ family response regulator
MISIVVADDHALVCEGLCMILQRQPDMAVVGQARTGAEAVALSRALKPAVLVLDVGLPDIDGFEVLEQIKAQVPEVCVIMISGTNSEQYIQRAVRSGASGYVVKEGGAAALIHAVRMVAQGGIALDWRGNTNAIEPDVAKALAQQPPPRHGTLTWRERQILRLVAQGYANGEVASLLGISAKTVDTHRMRIMEKLNLHSRAELTRYALEYGYLIVA